MIDSAAGLRSIYPEPTGRTLKKQLAHLDRHCRQFLALSPFVVLTTASGDGRLDASLRGGAPGFIHVADDRTLWLPDARGNNRLDSLTNVTETGRAGLLVLVPGIDETLRINGTSRIRDDAEPLAAFASERIPPRTVLEVTVEEAYLHCAKAFMRSRLWNPESYPDHDVLPTMGEMLNDQTGSTQPPETQEEMRARYAKDL